MPAAEVGLLDPGQVAESFGVLPTLAPVAAQLLRLADDERASLDDIARVISRDPALAAQLLRVANSALFGMATTTTSLTRAASILGLRTVKLLSLSFSVVTRPDGSDPGATLVWRHTLVTSAMARVISTRLAPRLADECFAAGLLGNLGRLALAEYGAYARAAHGDPVWLEPEDELAAVGCTSDEVTARVLAGWGLPGVLGDAIRHRCDPAVVSGPTATIATVLAVASSAARLVIADPAHAGAALQAYRRMAGRHLALTEKESEALLVEAAPTLEEIAAMFRSENPHDVPIDLLLLRAKDSLARLSLATVAALSSEERRALMLESENRRLAEQATTDTLTALPNRRAFEDFMTQALAERGRRDVPGVVGLLMIDLDHFKSINDVHGHRIGDAVLRLMGAMLALHTRQEELSARIGGEEFAVVLPVTDPRSVSLAAERFRNAIAGEPLDTPAGPLRVTASVGGAWLDDGAPHAARRLYDAADVALRTAKLMGRNRAITVRVE
ncbi:diguanylate cyclase [Isoptericola sp. b441]|uniref:Diguanylate cyclase n=1 Tax=Actinotalea lenta TaxID=3064654 RepID=A0ABT9DA05_9CELL|nr:MULTISPECIES: GGDEF domain-containing protein [unclassified Isoptericola]MDO8107701.1 diguanylate cyclase [Isoptericola sp. b441]MDO8120628.1 diguanylate cyclase [Isoptericola sp. b490]